MGTASLVEYMPMLDGVARGTESPWTISSMLGVNYYRVGVHSNDLKLNFYVNLQHLDFMLNAILEEKWASTTGFSATSCFEQWSRSVELQKDGTAAKNGTPERPLQKFTC